MALANPKRVRDQIQSIANAYGRGDERFMAGSGSLVVSLNEAWIDLLDEHLESGEVFVAIGAGHLLGGNSLRALLERRGYKFRRLGP